MIRSAISGVAPTEQDSPVDYVFDTPQIKAVSFSRMNVFEECPYRALLAFSRKIPEPPPPSGVETPLDRGTRVHKDAERFVRNAAPLSKELEPFRAEFEALKRRRIAAPETVMLEEMWCFDKDWQPVPWNAWDAIWVRVKQDAVVIDGERITCVDYKTGKKVGNEVKHNTQLRIAALAAMFRFPDAQEFIIENWYTDQNICFPVQYTRAEVEDFFDELNTRLRAVTEATSYEPSPSEHNCFFCPYRSGKVGKYIEGTGDCTHSAI